MAQKVFEPTVKGALVSDKKKMNGFHAAVTGEVGARMLTFSIPIDEVVAGETAGGNKRFATSHGRTTFFIPDGDDHFPVHLNMTASG